MRPQQAAVAHLVQLRDAHPVPVGLDMLGDDIHRDLAQIEVTPDARGGGDAGRAQHVADDLLRQLARGQAVGREIGRDIHEHLVDRIDVDILGRDVLQIDLVNARAVFI